jgi:hypothetical protein
MEYKRSMAISPDLLLIGPRDSYILPNLAFRGPRTLTGYLITASNAFRILFQSM